MHSTADPQGTLTFPFHSRPTISVVIPVFGNWPLTRACLAALRSNHDRVSHEVIVVDDASEDETREQLDLLVGVTILRNETNRGYLLSCLAGAERARGDHIAFLNNDTTPTSGWLDEMVFVFRNFADVGLVGSKLIYPDGSLQEAGGIVWANGDPTNYGRGEKAARPEFGFTREVDYVSGAAMAIDRKTWQQVGGFSEEFTPAYFEDTDLAFKVRSVRKRVIYAPLSVVIHHEGMSSGTDAKLGVKRYQELNRPLFKAKWAAALKSHPVSGTNVRLAAEHRAGRRKALFVADPGRGLGGADEDRQSIQDIRLLQSLGYRVTLATVRSMTPGAITRGLERIGVEVWAPSGAEGLRRLLEQRPSEFEVGYFTDPESAAAGLPTIRRVAPNVKVLVKAWDLDELLRIGRTGHGIGARITGSAALQRQGRAIREADVVLTHRRFADGHAPGRKTALPRTVTAPYVLDAADPAPASSERQGILILGDHRSRPDRAEIESFCREVMPLVLERCPDATLHVSGTGVERALRFGEVELRTEAASFEDLLRRCRVAVAPFRSDHGPRGQVMEALAQGVPQVLARAALEWSDLPEGSAVLVATSPLEWAAHVTALYGDDGRWRASSEASSRLARESYSFDAGRSLMRQALAKARLPVAPDVEPLVSLRGRPIAD